jgi:hypothetical protein
MIEGIRTAYALCVAYDSMEPTRKNSEERIKSPGGVGFHESTVLDLDLYRVPMTAQHSKLGVHFSRTFRIYRQNSVGATQNFKMRRADDY